MSLVLRQYACDGEYHLTTYDSNFFFSPISDMDLITAYLAHGTSERHDALARLIFVTVVWVGGGACPI